MTASLAETLQRFLRMTAHISAGIAIRYTLFAGIAWLLGYVFFHRRWIHRKIIARMPQNAEMWREARYSALTVVIFAAVGAVTIMAARAGWTGFIWRSKKHGWDSFWICFWGSVFLHDAYFYWTHRLMHHRWFFRLFHRAHHLSHNPSPWASYAFDPLEAVVQAGIFPLTLILIPFNPIAYGLFMLWQITFNVIGHTGYEYNPRGFMNSWVRFFLNTPTNHVMHHEKMRGNYGLYFNFWDRLMKTNHEDYERRFREVTSRPAPTKQDEPSLQPASQQSSPAL